MDRIIWFGLGFISSAIITLFTHVLSIRRDRRKEFNEAAFKFRKAFTHEINQLRFGGENIKVSDILTTKALIRHQNAFIEFREFIRGESKLAFEFAWINYFRHNPHPGNSQIPEHQYNECDEEDERKVVLSKIYTLFHFASFK